jgi:hypothetical protein
LLIPVLASGQTQTARAFLCDLKILGFGGDATLIGRGSLVDWIHGIMPGAFTLPAGIGDVTTGLLALPAAVWVASGFATGRKIGIRWNLFGLADFAVAVTMGMLTSPGPAHLLALEHPNVQIAMFPTTMTPAFVVPFSILLHVLSLRQLKRAPKTSSTAATAFLVDCMTR